MRRLLGFLWRRTEPAMRPGVSRGFEVQIRVQFREPLPDELVGQALCRFLGEIQAMHLRGTFVFSDPRLMDRDQGASVYVSQPISLGVPVCTD